VFDKDGKKLASVGGLGFADYPYIKSHTTKYACRKLYRSATNGTDTWRKCGVFADKLLW
jgi:hypothetical protein